MANSHTRSITPAVEVTPDYLDHRDEEVMQALVTAGVSWRLPTVAWMTSNATNWWPLSINASSYLPSRGAISQKLLTIAYASSMIDTART